jgi:hypothetical protein
MNYSYLSYYIIVGHADSSMKSCSLNFDMVSLNGKSMSSNILIQYLDILFNIIHHFSDLLKLLHEVNNLPILDRRLIVSISRYLLSKAICIVYAGCRVYSSAVVTVTLATTKWIKMVSLVYLNIEICSTCYLHACMLYACNFNLLL